MFVLDAVKFKEAVKRQGYRSLGELARLLGIHRNTIHFYLSGHRIFPAQFEKMIRTIGLKPTDVLIEKGEELFSAQSLALIVDQLHREFPEITFVLFGSRAQGRAHRYSDWDVGVYSRQGISHPVYRALARRKDELVESLPVMLDLVNLNRADTAFLKEISKGWTFLTGSQQDWIELKRSVLQ